MSLLAVFVSITLSVLLQQVDGTVDAKSAKDLAKMVYKSIIDHAHGADKNGGKFAFTYIHYDEGLTMSNVFETLKSGEKMPQLKDKDPSYWPAPNEGAACVDNNFRVGVFNRGEEHLKISQIKRVFQILDEVNSPKCPKLVIFGRSKYSDKNIDLNGWPEGADGFRQKKRNVANQCSETQFFYYVYETPKAETQLKYFAKHNVNLDFSSDH